MRETAGRPDPQPGGTDEGTGTRHLWSLCEDTLVMPGTEEGELVVLGPWKTEHLKDAPPIAHEALRRMQMGPVLLTNLEPGADGTAAREAVSRERASPDGALIVLLPVLDRLAHTLVRTLALDDLRGPLLSMEPVSPDVAPFTAPQPPEGQLVRLPRGVSCTVESSGFRLELAGARHRVRLHRPEAGRVVGLLGWPVTPHAASQALRMPPGVVRQILGYLAAAGMLVPAEAPPGPHVWDA